jgi:hypothetical protein
MEMDLFGENASPGQQKIPSLIVPSSYRTGAEQLGKLWTAQPDHSHLGQRGHCHWYVVGCLCLAIGYDTRLAPLRYGCVKHMKLREIRPFSPQPTLSLSLVCVVAYV